MFWKRSISVAILAAALIAAVAAGPARAAEVKELRLVLVPERNIFAQERKYRLMCDYICAVTSITVTFDVLKSYQDVMAQIEDGQAAGGFLGSFLGLHGIEMHDFVPLVRPLWTSGESTYSSVIFTRPGSGITQDVSTWRGKKIAMVSPHTSAGFFFPLALLRENGIEDPSSFFSDQVFAGSHDASIWMVSRGMADIGAAKNTVYEETVDRKAQLQSELRVLYDSGAYPDSTLMLRSDVPASVRDALMETFLHMHEQEEGRAVLQRFGAQRFLESRSEHYDTVREVVRNAGFDLRTIKVADH